MFKKIFKGIGKALKGIGRAVKKVVSGIGKAIKSIFKSPVFKAVALGAAIFFGVPWIAGKLAVGAAGKAGLAGASWWKSTLGIGAQAGAAAGSAGTAAGSTAATGATMGATNVGAAGSAASTGTAINALPAMSQAGSHAGLAAKAAGINAGGGLMGAGAQAGSWLGSAAKGAGKAAGSMWGGMGDVAKGALITTGGNMISGYAKAKAEEEALEDERQREDELKNKQSIFGVRYDGTNVNQAYDPASMMPDYSQGYQPGLISQRPQERPEWLAANPAALHFV